MSIYGRVIVLKELKNATFFEIRSYSDQKKSFQIIKCCIEKKNCANFERLRSELFLGAYINCFDFFEAVDKKNNLLLNCNNIEVFGAKTGPFPKRFKLNAIENKETLYKDRVLSLCTNDRYLDILNKKYKILNLIRSTFVSMNYQEVNIPVFETFFGGADAKPFLILSNYNKKKYYLRTCFEFPLKGLLIAGFPKIFYIGSAFRNENLDRTHTPEFLFVEAYGINETYTRLIAVTEKLYRDSFFECNKTFENHNFDLRKPWPIYSEASLNKIIEEGNFKDLDQLIDSKKLGPYFHVQGYDCILAKRSESRIESYCDYNLELAHYYEEENDHDALLKKSEKSENKVPVQFLNNLAYGMANATGWGMGIDRLVMSCTKADSLREVQEYPML